jgi:hypothetical protein
LVKGTGVDPFEFGLERPEVEVGLYQSRGASLLLAHTHRDIPARAENEAKNLVGLFDTISARSLEHSEEHPLH